jgi:signal transduction histidine kinase
MPFSAKASRAGLWIPSALAVGAVGLTAVGLLALRSTSDVARVRAAQAGRGAVQSTARAIEGALGRVAERVGDPERVEELVKLASETPGAVLAFSLDGAGAVRAPAPESRPASAPVKASERVAVEAYLEEAAYQEHSRQDLTAAEKALDNAAKASSDAGLRAGAVLARAGFELRRGKREEARGFCEQLLTGPGAAAEPPALREARAMARQLSWRLDAARPAPLDVDHWGAELAACRPEFGRALVAEAQDGGQLDARQADAIRGRIGDAERRTRLTVELERRGRDLLEAEDRVTPAAGLVVCLGARTPNGRGGVAVNLTRFSEAELASASEIARAAGFPVVLDTAGGALAEAEPLAYSGGEIRVGLPADFDPAAAAVGFPVWASAVLVLLLGASVGGGAWFLTRAAKREIAAAEAKSEFLAGVTHELKTPLASIRLYGEMLEEGRVAAEKRQEYVKTIGREAERLTQLVDRVLALARAEQGAGLTRSAETVSAGEVAAGTERAFRPAAEADGIRFAVEVGEPETRLVADPASLVQAILDLLENARKYGLDGGEVELRGYADRAARQYCFEVLDRGPGLPPGDAERLFTMFARGEGDSVRGKVGLGIGLALSRKIVEAQGGTLGARNREGGGAVFKIELPLTTESQG